ERRGIVQFESVGDRIEARDVDLGFDAVQRARVLRRRLRLAPLSRAQGRDRGSYLCQISSRHRHQTSIPRSTMAAPATPPAAPANAARTPRRLDSSWTA